MKQKLTEAEVAGIVLQWLEALGADVYQEVEADTLSDLRADIVAVVGPEVWIIETKTSLSLALVEQLLPRRRLAHRVYAAAPCGKARCDGDVFRELGLGLLDVHKGSGVRWDYDQVTLRVESRRWNSRPVALRSKLTPAHKTHAKAGSTTGGHWTPFRATIEDLAAKVRQQPGISLKEAIASIKHHYRTMAGARSSLAHWISVGKVPGIRSDGGRLWPAETVR